VVVNEEVVRGVETIAGANQFLCGAMVERDIEAWLAMVALVSRQHLFLLGPPGTAKSLLAQFVRRALGPETPYFELLLTRFTDPNEVFGPVRIKRFLEDEEYLRKTERYLPWATIAFLDEIWKSSSAVLNALLTIVNERKYDNGGQRVDVPLQTLFAASNELPQDSSLAALYDRFLIRREVSPVSEPLKLLDLPELDSPPPIENLAQVQAACRAVVLPKLVKETMLSIKDHLASEEDIQVGDRRFRQSASLVQASAILEGREEADLSDLLVLAHCYWETPDQQQSVSRIVCQRIESAKILGSIPAQPPPWNPPPPDPPTPLPLPPSPPPFGYGQPLTPMGQLMQDLHGMSNDMIAANPPLHQRIHDCIVSTEATDPRWKAEAHRLVSIKQHLVTYNRWQGPRW
jgi:MoxR-like ATPase